MKLYSTYTESHAAFKDKFFLPSLKDNFDLVIVKGVQTSEAAYMGRGWNDLMAQKVDVILRAIDENAGRAFVYSDVDVQFFRPVEQTLADLVRHRDMVIQMDAPDGTLCAGFFVCIGNERTRRLWGEIRRRVEADQSEDDQGHLNRILVGSCSQLCRRAPTLFRLLRRVVGVHRIAPLLKNEFGIRWGYLPVQFLGGGTLGRRIWEPGMPFEIPRDAYLHHGNWSVGVVNKLAQMQLVRDTMARASEKQRRT